MDMASMMEVDSTTEVDMTMEPLPTPNSNPTPSKPNPLMPSQPKRPPLKPKPKQLNGSGLIPWTQLEPKALEQTKEIVSVPWFNFYSNVFGPKKQQLANGTNSPNYSRTRIPHFPLEAKSVIEDMLMFKNPSGVVSKSTEISTIPSIKELNKMTKKRSCLVNHFTVIHQNYGSMTFCGELDVYGINLDEIWVKSSDEDQLVLPNYEVLSRFTNFPVRFDVNNVWPVNDQGQTVRNFVEPHSLENYEMVIKASCDQHGWTYIGYDSVNGCLTCEVDYSKLQQQPEEMQSVNPY